MLSAPEVGVDVRWCAAAPTEPEVRARLAAEVRRLGWTLSEMEALLDDAHRLAATDAWLLPRLELRLPLYDVGKRYRIQLTCVDRPRIQVVDEAGRRVADVRIV